MHSRASDGTGTVEDIAAAASRAGLQFVVITDHGDATRRPLPPRYVDGVLCIEAVEISTTDGHYAALGLAPPPYPLGGEARDVVEDVARLGGFGIAAHPDSAKTALRWHEWDAPFDAMEWFNADSQWRDEARWRLLPAILQYPLRPVGGRRVAVRPARRPAPALGRTRRPAARRRASPPPTRTRGWGWGQDRPVRRVVYVRVPSYEAVFRAFSLRVELREPLSGDAAARCPRPSSTPSAPAASRRRSTAWPAPARSRSRRERAERVRQGGWLALSGQRPRSRGRANGPPQLAVAAARRARWSRAGRRPGRSSGTADQPGAYRIEARMPGAPGDPPLPWMVSNPIYVGLPAGNPGPRAPAAPSASLVWPARRWHIEKDERSSGTWRDGRGRGVIRHTLRYRLGRESASPFVALVTYDAGAMHDAARFAFRAAADRPMRLSVQVRLARRRASSGAGSARSISRRSRAT